MGAEGKGERVRWVASRLDAIGRRSRQSLYGSLAFVTVVGGAYCLRQGARIRFADEGDYLALAENIDRLGKYTADGVHATAFRPPGYPALLGVLLRLGLPESALRAVNVVFLAVVVAGAWWLARRISGDTAAALAAPLVALYPITFFTMGTLVPQPMGASLLVVGVVTVVLFAERRRTWVVAIGGGFVFGLLGLTIPTFGLSFVVALAWLVSQCKPWRDPWKVTFAPLLAMVAAAALLPGLWFARNLAVMDSPVLVATNGGLNLLLGNSEHAGPRTGAMTDITVYEAEAEARGLDEVDTDSYYQEEALGWMADHPVDAVVLYGEKTLNYFAPFDRLATGGESSAAREAIAVAAYVPLVVVLVARLIRRRRQRPGAIEGLLLLLYLSAAPIQAVFFTRVRFRAPLDPLLVVLAVCAVVGWIASSESDHAEN